MFYRRVIEMNLIESLLKENRKISKEKRGIKEDVGVNDTLVGQEWRTYKDSPNYEENELFETDPVNLDFEKLNDEPIKIEYVADEHDESRDFVPSFWFENRRHYLDDYVKVHDNPWFSNYDNFPNYIHGVEGDVYSHPLFVEIIDGEYVNVYRENERRTESKKVVKEFIETDAPFEVYGSRGFRVPEGVKENITHIIIEDGVESIQRSAFANCSSLEEIQIPESVVSIGPGAFEGCSSLEFIQLPSGLEEIRAYTFAGCTSLKEITIPENTTWIAYGAFAHSGLTYVKILSKGLDYIADDAFDGCDPLLDATQATINFDFGAFCEKNDLACEVEFEESKKVVKESYGIDYFETEDAVYSSRDGKYYVHLKAWDDIPGFKYHNADISVGEYVQAYRRYENPHIYKDKKKRENKKVVKESYNAEYITKDLVDKSGIKSLENAYERNNLDIVEKDNVWWCEKCYPDRLFKTVYREMKKHYPELTYLYDRRK